MSAITIERVHQLIREGIESGPAVGMTDEDWDQIRRSVRERLSRPAASSEVPEMWPCRD
jgi:hypothetical protein